jgi:TonB family protein
LVSAKERIMKKYIPISALILSLIVVQGCVFKIEGNSEELMEASVLQEKDEQAILFKRASLAKALSEKSEQRSAAIEAKAKLSPTYKDAFGKLIYNKAEVDPCYTGGQDELEEFLKNNLRYPQTARENSIEGTVFVDFVIDGNGKVREVVASDVVGEDVDYSLKEEAVRLVGAMPRWKAGTQQGSAVDASFSIPVTFELLN